MSTPTLSLLATSVLTYWFGTQAGDAATAQAKRKLWWSKDAAVDADIRIRFGALMQAAANGAHNDWVITPRGRLALILLFDQFPRNIHRDTPHAFSFDPRALQLALDGIAAGMDRQLRPVERVFGYLPLEHAESTIMQERSVELFTALAADAPDNERDTFKGFVDYAVRHREVIARFGRFPHRNRILGRISTVEEIEFLKQPGSSF